MRILVLIILEVVVGCQALIGLSIQRNKNGIIWSTIWAEIECVITVIWLSGIVVYQAAYISMSCSDRQNEVDNKFQHNGTVYAYFLY
jgi:heme/copper-type cytochrome/quinol oxidase subunit 2